MKKLCLLFIILFIKISAQTEIKGFVFSNSNQVLNRANVILLNQNEDIETFVFSNKDGSFSFFTDKTGFYKLKITSFNFLPKEIDIKILQKNQKIDVGKIVLNEEKTKEIKEVVLSKTNAIKLKKDTIEYRVANFSNGTELNVEDLLKKLPGVTVDSQGKIKIGNKEVERVMVENDDLFERGYQTLTQNMPTKPVEKVQVLKNYSKNKLLKNIENSESVAINLTLKEDAKNVWFGNLLLASTSYIEKMRQVKLNLMNFSKKKKVYLLFNANNLGLNEMKGVEYLINPSSDKDLENVGSDIRTISAINLHRKNFQFEDKRTNFNNDKLGSINYIYNFKNDVKLKFVTIFNEIENKNYIDSYYKFNYNGVNFTNIESKTWKQNNTNIVGKLELTKDFKKDANLVFYNKVSSQKEDNNNLFIFNGENNNQNGENKLFSNENKLVYTKKIDSSRALVAVAKYIFQNRPYNFTDENDVFSYLINNSDVKKINQKVESKMNFAGAKLSYVKKYKNDKSFQIQLGNEWKKDFLDTDIFLLDTQNQVINFNKNEYVNNIDFSQNNIFNEIKYNKKNEKGWSYDLSLYSQFIVSYFNGTNKSGVYFSPNFSINYQNRKIGKFSFSGSRKFSSVTINDLNINYIYQGNRSLEKSDIGIKIMPSYNVGLSYNVGNVLDEYLNFNINFYRDEDYISNDMIVNPNYTINQSILVRNNKNINLSLELKKYLKFIKSKISLSNDYMLSNYENSINNQDLISTKFAKFKTGVEMKSGWRSFANYELGYEWSFNRIKSTVNQNNYLDEKGYFNLYFVFSSKFRLDTQYEYYKFGNTTQKNTQFLDAKINYTFNKLKMNLFLQGNNLLNNNSIQKYSINNISESVYTQKLMPLNIVLGVNKNF